MIDKNRNYIQASSKPECNRSPGVKGCLLTICCKEDAPVEIMLDIEIASQFASHRFNDRE